MGIEYSVEIRGYSSDWERYIRHYNFNYISGENSEHGEVLFKDDEINSDFKFKSPPKTSFFSLKIIIVEPEGIKLAPVNLLITIAKNGEEIEVHKVSRVWNKDHLMYELTFRA